MMNRTTGNARRKGFGLAGLGCLLFLLSVVLAPTAVSQETPKKIPGVDVFEVFEGRITLQTPTGQQRTLRVSLRNWIVADRTAIKRFPAKGTVVLELRGGELKTVTDGKTREYSEGAFLLKRAGTALSIETDDDSAVFQTLAIQE